MTKSDEWVALALLDGTVTEELRFDEPDAECVTACFERPFLEMRIALSVNGTD